jgi:esterase/lipase superfamily enzyme
MHREYHKWWSPSLGRDMEMLIIGHAGARVLIFPTSKGKYYEWEDRKMFSGWALGEHVERGWLQCYCVDSVDAESWYNYGVHPGARGYRHTQYLNYVMGEVIPLSLQKNSNPFLMSVGASFGAFHAMSIGLKYPDKFDRIIALSGMFDIRTFTDGYSDDNVYFNNPMQFIQNEHEGHRLAALRHLDIIMATGRDDRLMGQARAMSSLLWSKGIGNALREWDGWSHDWQYWHHMMKSYVGGHD